ncbi:TIGR02680 family protein [Catenulispora rubra]|uniref:TIGR02680 family protein n=1 Tax=Catenulispora rubra TaxID=280293 RepID=UPI001892091F|nr:TIGR02680 family protein [Catenulispora rubra]
MSDRTEPGKTRLRPERWRLHRSGFVDVWVYGIQNLDISGGRQILQGANGSGKSRSLELQLPFCLDGDLKYLGTKGANSVSMRRLMLDDHDGAGVRIGYCWLELRRVRGGEEEFLTCGVGVRAVKTSNEVKGVWRFVTPLRVGHEFELVSADRVALDMAELEERLGRDAVFENFEDFRERVAPIVYGIADPRRYQDLLHLQRTLRNPDVGLKAATGELEEYLSLALPPLNPDLLARLAGQLQDLEAIGTNIKRLDRADIALRHFMMTYAAYTQAVLRQRGAALKSARKQLTAHLVAAGQRKTEVAEFQRKAVDLEKGLADLEQEQHALRAQIRDMEGSDQYRELSDIDRRRRSVEARRGTVHELLESAKRARDAERRACEGALREMAGVYAQVLAFRTGVDDAAAKLVAMGLDRALVPTPPNMAAPMCGGLDENVLVSVATDPDPALQSVQRLLPPELAADRLTESVDAALVQVGLAADAVSSQRVRIGSLVQEGKELAVLQTTHIAPLRIAAEQAGTAETTAEETLAVARSALDVQVVAWRRAQEEWLAMVPSSTVELGPPPERLETIELSDDCSAAVAAARRRLRAWAAAALDAAQDGVHQARTDLRELSADRRRRGEERQALLDGAEITPPEHGLARDERHGRVGAPFFRLVDFVTGVRAEDRAGLEAALQGCGLLNAWVFPDGTLADPKLADLVILVPGASPSDAERDADVLSRILTPSGELVDSVPEDVVRRLLSAVRLEDEQDGTDDDGLSVSTTGRWRAGVLTGLGVKEVAEYVGDAAREDTRARRIVELDAVLATADIEIGKARTVLQDRTEAHRAWRRHSEDTPESGALLLAHTAAALAEAARRKAAEVAKQAIISLGHAQERWDARHNAFARQAAEANLPHDPAKLAQCDTAATQATDACNGLRERGLDLSAAIEGLAPGKAAYASAMQGRVLAEKTAAGEYSAFCEERVAIDLLVSSLGLGPAEFEEQLTELRRLLESVERNIPMVRQDKEDARTQAAKREGLTESDATVEADKRKAVSAAERALVQTVTAPGFWMAAAGSTETFPPADPLHDDLLARIAGFPDRPADRDVLTNEVGNLNKRLPNDLSAEFSSVGEDAFAVMVRGDDGLQPAAAEARSVKEQLETNRAKLDDSYRAIFEQYLLQDLSEHLRYQIDTASVLCDSMNAILAETMTSQGIGVQLAWEPANVIDGDTRKDLQLVKKSLAVRTPEEDDRLRRALQERIEAERERHHGLYAPALAEALDYRKWYSFTVKVQDKDANGKERLRAFKKLSSGETRFVAYMVLIAAAGAFYDALTEPGTDPLRVVLLDEAFERIDDPTITKLLELLAELDMDWIITWPGGSAFSPKIERMHVYDVLRHKNSRSIALMHTTWDGGTLRRDE